MTIMHRSAAISLLSLAAALSAQAPLHAQALDADAERSIAETAFRDPQSPDVYRALSGMGDAHVGAVSDAFDEVYSTNDPKQVALLKQLFPDDTSSGDQFWVGGENCRLVQPLNVLRSRIATLGERSPYVQQWIRVQRAVFTACSYSRTNKASAKVATLPPPLATRNTRIAGIQRDDRAYQAATALFYARHMGQAAQAFDRIAASRSEHRYYARYMGIAIRAGTQVDRNSYAPLAPVGRSLSAARALVADRAAPADVRRDAYDLIGWIGASDQGLEARRAQVDATLQALEAPLGRLKTDDEAQRRYADARDTRDHLFSATNDAAALWTGAVPANLTGTMAMVQAARTDRLAEWMVFPKSPWQPVADYRGGLAWATATMPTGVERVRSELEQLAPDPGNAANPWAHEALMWSDHYDPTLWAMVDGEAQSKAAHDERALHMADLDFYHQVRTAIMAGGADGFDAALAHLASVSDRHSLMWTTTVRETLRYLMVRDRITEAFRVRDRLDLVSLARADDSPRPNDAPYLSYSMRESGSLNVLILLAEDEDHLAPLLSDSAYDQAPLLNRLPIAEMRRLAARPDVATEWRSALARTAWTRTYALGRPVDPDLDRLMRSLNPDITAHWRSRPGRAIRPGDRLALQDVLATPALNALIDEYGRHRKTPGMMAQGILPAGIDHNKNDDDDWWCPWNPKTNDVLLDDALASTLISAYGDNAFADPAKPSDWNRERDGLLRSLRSASFLMRSADPAEIQSLTQIRCAPELLTERAIDWVEHPGLVGSRKGQPEALANAIVATRWGCDWAGRHGVYSRAAFTLLHTRFPNADASKHARYWYDCNGECAKDDEGHPANNRSDALPAVPTLPAASRREARLVDRIWAKPAL